MKLLFATGNEKKFELMKRRLKSIPYIEVVMPKQLGINVFVNENGKTAEENSTIKALAYHEATGMATIAEDSGLWIEQFSEEEQPGLHVKRVNGVENLSDSEVLSYYTLKLSKIGEGSLARYITGVSIIDESGKVHSFSISEKPFMLKAKPNTKGFLAGGVLDCISYDLELKKYFNEFTEEEKNFRYLGIDAKTLEMCKKVFKEN